MDFDIVPDNLREREPIKRGRSPKNKLSRALLNGSTLFIRGSNKTFGSLYNLAKNHNMKCRTQRTTLHNEEGTLVWFEKPVVSGELGTNPPPPPPPDKG